MGFSRQEYWSGLPFPSPGDLPNPEMEPGSPALQADSLPSEPPEKLQEHWNSLPVSSPREGGSLPNPGIDYTPIKLKTKCKCILYLCSPRDGRFGGSGTWVSLVRECEPCTPRSASLSVETSLNVKMSPTDASQRGALCSSSLGGTFKREWIPGELSCVITLCLQCRGPMFDPCLGI